MFFGRSDHCHQWFYDGFLMLLPSLSMVFDGSGPLVKRCDGFDGSLWSKSLHHDHAVTTSKQEKLIIFLFGNSDINFRDHFQLILGFLQVTMFYKV